VRPNADVTDDAKCGRSLRREQCGTIEKPADRARGKRGGYRDMRPTDTLRYAEGAHPANAATERSQRVRESGV
jgi:hypothetical protein